MAVRFDQPSAVVVLVGIMAVVGGVVGGIFDVPGMGIPGPPCPLPHLIAKHRGGASLRFAMVQDVVTERYPRHGPAYYEERNRLTRRALDDEATRHGTDTPRYLSLQDDLAAGLDRLGRHAESVALMRAKLKRQLELGQSGTELYSTYANLGTFLILWEIDDGFADKEKARQGLTEGLGLIRLAIAIKPDSHFGREIWQAVILEYLLALLDHPELAARYDMVGNPSRHHIAYSGTASSAFWHRRWCKQLRIDASDLEDFDATEREQYRRYITNLTPEPEWCKALRSSHTEPVPFDEPTLGIVGMWRMGGGPNPFFAVALGEIMMRVGQNYIAWNAFERAVLLSDGVGPESVREEFRQNCRDAQTQLERAIPEKDLLRTSFEKNLQTGLAYQQAYQAYEAERIRAGASIEDPHFYDAFETQHGSIASPVGFEDFRVSKHSWSPGLMILTAGLFALATIFLIRLRDARTRRQLARESQGRPS